MVKEIQLTQGQVALVDDEYFDRVNQYKWCAHWRPKEKSYRAVRTIWEGNISKTIIMSRFILNAQDNQEVDHKDHNTLDNRRNNIRLCTETQNKHNRRKHKDNTSGFLGVNYRPKSKRFRACINIGSDHIHIGYFDTAKEAALAYNNKAKELHGEFCCLNEI